MRREERKQKDRLTGERTILALIFMKTKAN